MAPSNNSSAPAPLLSAMIVTSNKSSRILICRRGRLFQDFSLPHWRKMVKNKKKNVQDIHIPYLNILNNVIGYFWIWTMRRSAPLKCALQLASFCCIAFAAECISAKRLIRTRCIPASEVQWHKTYSVEVQVSRINQKTGALEDNCILDSNAL